MFDKEKKKSQISKTLKTKLRSGQKQEQAFQESGNLYSQKL